MMHPARCALQATAGCSYSKLVTCRTSVSVSYLSCKTRLWLKLSLTEALTVDGVGDNMYVSLDDTSSDHDHHHGLIDSETKMFQ